MRLEVRYSGRVELERSHLAEKKQIHLSLQRILWGATPASEVSLCFLLALTSHRAVLGMHVLSLTRLTD
jgi:hypothetical protein